jgi:hypothetical protein
MGKFQSVLLKMNSSSFATPTTQGLAAASGDGTF